MPGKSEKEPNTEELTSEMSFGRCLLSGRLYYGDVHAPLRQIYILPLFAAYLLLDLSFRYLYRDIGIVSFDYAPACLFSLGWAMVFCGLVFVLPGLFRRIALYLPPVIFAVLAVVHSGLLNMLGKFFSFSLLEFVGGGNFASTEYILLNWAVVAWSVLALLLVLFSGRLLRVIPPEANRRTVLAGLAAVLLGAGLVFHIHATAFPEDDTVFWQAAEDEHIESTTYRNYTDPTNALLVSGLYQYTVRDIYTVLFPAGGMTDEEREQAEAYITAYHAAAKENDYTGLFEGKNLILVQMEAIDTWMADPDYMPNLCALKEEGISFANHYTPAYISAGTFNTEFIVNNGILPATGGVQRAVYQENAFPYSLAFLFEDAGYTARSFHGSRPTVYNRGQVHVNWGYESYTSGFDDDMKMPSYQMDRQLINGFDSMTGEEPFFSFIITYSGHGPYSEESGIYKGNAEEAQVAAKSTEGKYVFAVAGAMETDRFIGELRESLKKSGMADDTVLVLYADHYNYYMSDDGLQMQIKGVNNMNMLQHTDWIIWAEDLEPETVEKVTASYDVLPTLANLFGFDVSEAFLVGHDAFGDGGGYAFFSDGSWYDGRTYWSSRGEVIDPARSEEIDFAVMMSNAILSGDYYRAEDP